MKKKKRNPNDATIRNVRAASKRIEALEAVLSVMITKVWTLTKRISKLERGRK